MYILSIVNGYCSKNLCIESRDQVLIYFNIHSFAWHLICVCYQTVIGKCYNL